MQVGDYVRTKHYGISKILDISNETTTNYCSLKLDKIDDFGRLGVYISRGNIIKLSPNIIDLIEAGDIITFKEDNDVYRIASVPDKEIESDVFYLEKNFDGETEDIWVKPKVMEECIKSIVTKEQFERMEYEVK